MERSVFRSTIPACVRRGLGKYPTPVRHGVKYSLQRCLRDEDYRQKVLKLIGMPDLSHLNPGPRKKAEAPARPAPISKKWRNRCKGRGRVYHKWGGWKSLPPGAIHDHEGTMMPTIRRKAAERGMTHERFCEDPACWAVQYSRRVK